jgi:hypothetical protein
MQANGVRSRTRSKNRRLAGRANRKVPDNDAGQERRRRPLLAFDPGLRPAYSPVGASLPR